MDCLERARAQYGEYHCPGSNLSQEKQASISSAISKLIRTSLLQQGGSASFRFLPFCHVIQSTVSANRFCGDKTAAAFLTLEKYLLLLAQQPWKREFWLMKLYGGYYCTKVRAHLEGGEEILQLIGFVPEHAAEGNATASTTPAAAAASALCLCLILQEAPDPQVALNVAFDCQVAALECQCIGEYHSKWRGEISLVDATILLLSGASSDPLVGSLSTSGGRGELVGRSSGGVGGGLLGNIKVSYNPGSLLPDAFPAGRERGSSFSVKSHTVLASGGMGMGVVTGAGAKSVHQVIGVQPSGASSSSATHHASVLAGAGGGVTHQVIGVSPTHHHRSAMVVSGVGGGGGSFPMTGGTVLSRVSPTESYSVVSEPSAMTAAVRGSSSSTGAGHSVLHVMGVPASTHPSSAPTSHHMSPDPLPRKSYNPTHLQPTSAPNLLSSSASPPSASVSHSDPPYTSCPVGDSRLTEVEGLMAVLPSSQHQQPNTGLVVGGDSGRVLFMTAPCHPSSVVYQSPGSRGSYASSGYGSGTASVLSGGSSTCTASSGYGGSTSSSTPSQHEYANLPIKPLTAAGEFADSHHPAPLSRLSRGQSQKPQFPFIEEDEVGLGAPFPEATHEEHLRESLRNLQVSHPDKTQKRLLNKNLSSQLMANHHQNDQRTGGGSEGQAPVTYDDWRWFRGDSNKGLASPCKMGGEGGGGGMRSHQASGNVQLSAVHRPSSSSHSGTAVSRLPPSEGMVIVTDAVPPHSEGLVSQHSEASSWKASMTPNPVYYPPSGFSQLPDDLYCNTASHLMKGPILHPYPAPTSHTAVSSQRAAMMVAHPPPATARWEERVGSQTRTSLRVTASPPHPASPIYNNLDRTPAMKVLNVTPDVERPLSESVKRQDVVVSPSKGRGGSSSLGASPHYANLVDLTGGRGGGGHHGLYSLDGGELWACQSCTMENEASSNVCQVCGRSRGAGSPGGVVVSPFSVAGESRRVCPSCTFENPPGCHSCEVCEVLLPQDVHTYV